MIQIKGTENAYPSHVGDPSLTIRQHFANSAPEVPDWFKHKPIKPSTKMPRWESIENKDDAEEVRQWLADGNYDLPDHLLWFQQAVDQHNSELVRVDAENKIERYFQWRIFYAERMIAELNKPQQ